MLPKVYVETTVPSYLTAPASRDVIRAGQQAVTKLLWDQKKSLYQWFTSQLVLNESAAGDPTLARDRINWLSKIPILDQTDDTVAVAEMLLAELPFPPSATADAFHIAIACTNRMDFLLSWNCKHIANPAFAVRIADIASRKGYRGPVLCTPYELLGE